MNEITEIDKLCAAFIKYRRENPIRKKYELAIPAPEPQSAKSPKKSFKNRSNRGLPEFRAYRKIVDELTEAVAHLIPSIEKRGFKSYHIDHKISAWHGFNNGIPPEIIADLSNLRMLPYKENMLKGTKCV